MPDNWSADPFGNDNGHGNGLAFIHGQLPLDESRPDRPRRGPGRRRADQRAGARASACPTRPGARLPRRRPGRRAAVRLAGRRRRRADPRADRPRHGRRRRRGGHAVRPAHPLRAGPAPRPGRRGGGVPRAGRRRCPIGSATARARQRAVAGLEGALQRAGRVRRGRGPGVRQDRQRQAGPRGGQARAGAPPDLAQAQQDLAEGAPAGGQGRARRRARTSSSPRRPRRRSGTKVDPASPLKTDQRPSDPGGSGAVAAAHHGGHRSAPDPTSGEAAGNPAGPSSAAAHATRRARVARAPPVTTDQPDAPELSHGEAGAGPPRRRPRARRRARRTPAHDHARNGMGRRQHLADGDGESSEESAPRTTS